MLPGQLERGGHILVRLVRRSRKLPGARLRIFEKLGEACVDLAPT